MSTDDKLNFFPSRILDPESVYPQPSYSESVQHRSDTLALNKHEKAKEIIRGLRTLKDLTLSR
jgi:phosphopantetheine adenylyltransferase